MMNDKNIIAVISKIESSIFTKIYSYFSIVNPSDESAAQGERKKSLMEIIRSMRKEGERERDFNAAGELSGEGGPAPEETPPLSFKLDRESIEDVFSASEEQQNVFAQEIQYLEEQPRSELFLPAETDWSYVFYGTKHCYIFLRFFFTLYERFFKVFEICNKFEANYKTSLLSPQQKAELGMQRYEIFKIILVYSLRMKDATKYEDFLRTILGSKAFLSFTLDKVLSQIIKILHNFIQDSLSNTLLSSYVNSQLCKKEQKPPLDEVQLAKVISLDYLYNSTDKSLFRFHFDQQERVLYVNFFASYYKNWEANVLE